MEVRKIGIVILTLIMFSIVVVFIDLFISFGLLGKADPFFYRIMTVKNRWNKIHQCNICKKLSREYQRKIYAEANDKRKCPHCENHMYFLDTKAIKEKKWMNSHPDCPKVKFFDCIRIYRTIKMILKNKKIVKEQQFFEEYNRIEPDFSWIENLQRRSK